MTEQEIFEEVVYAFRGSLTVSADSYIIEKNGWYQIVSPSRLEASRNEVILSEIAEDAVEKKISEVISFYSDLGTSFKWCTNPLTKPDSLPRRLKEKGFQSWYARGMYCQPEKINIESNTKVTIEQVSSSNLDDYLNLFIEGWDLATSLKSKLAEDFEWAINQEDQRFHYFLVKSGDTPLGTAGFVKKEKSAYLIGGNILPRFRGKGFYKALVKKRLEIIKDLGIPLATTGARDHTSAPILEKFGFKTAYKSEIFQYDFN